MTRRATPPLPPIGLGRARAAAYIGADEALFVRLVEAGTMPPPRSIRGLQVWDADELANAFRQFPRWAPRADAVAAAANTAEDAKEHSDPVTVFTPKSLAERWECSERLVRNMINAGELPGFKLGGKLLRIKECDVEAFECQSGGSQGAAESDVNLFTPESLAERWQCSARHIRLMAAQGELPAFKLGGKLLRFRSEDIEAFEQRGNAAEGAPEDSLPDGASGATGEPKPDATTGSEQTRQKRQPAKPLLSRQQTRELHARWARESAASGKPTP